MNIKSIFTTDGSWVSAIQRAALGIVLFPHGAQKLLGWFGGYGFDGTVGFFTNILHIPAPLAVLVILIESLGAVALVCGLFTRAAAVGLVAVMLGAMAMVHAKVGFFMNWGGAQAGEGLEYHLLVLALAIPLVVTGAGRASVDAWIARKLASPRAVTPPHASLANV
jgi:putative oxidoreductase